MNKFKKACMVLAAGCTLTACTKYKTITGNMNEPVKTMFYNFTVNDCYSTKTLGTYTPADDKLFVVVNVTIENTYKSTLSMTDSHFQMQTLGTTDSSDDETESVSNGGVQSTVTATPAVDYVLPETTVSTEKYLDDELPAQYDLEKGESITGTLIFEMPAAETIFNFCSADYFDYGSSNSPVTGNTFFVEVTPEAK